MTGIRPHALMALSDELARLQGRTDQIELDLRRLMTSTELESVDSVALRHVGETAAELAQHLAWVHDELVGFSLDPYLGPAVFEPAGRLPDRPSAVAARGHQLDRLWADLLSRPGAALHGTSEFSVFAETVGASVETREQAFRVVQLVAAGQPPSTALRSVIGGLVEALPLRRDKRTYERAATLAMNYSATRVAPGAVERFEHLVTASTAPDGTFAQAVVHLAILVDFDLDQAASVLGTALNTAPWWGSAPLWSDSRRPTRAELTEAAARVEYLQVLAELPAGVMLTEARQMIIDRAADMAGSSPEIGFALLQMADMEFGKPPVLAIDQLEVALSLAELDWSNVDVNQLFSTTSLGAEALGDIKGAKFVGSAAKVGIGLTFFDALDRGDYDAALEIALDSAIPAAIKALLIRMVPVVAGPIGWIAALVLTFTTFGGPSWDGPHRAPANAADDGVEAPAANPSYVDDAGVPQPQRHHDVDSNTLLAKLLANLFEPQVAVSTGTD